MLTTNERLRLERAFPTPVTVTWDDGGSIDEVSVAYEPATIWTVGEHTEEPFDEYPVIAFDDDSRGDRVGDEYPANSLASRVSNEDGTEVIETNEVPESDIYSITVAVKRRFRDGIPARIRAEQITEALWHWVEFDAIRELNTEGENGERPMTVEPTSAPTPTPLSDTYRIEFSIEVQYTVSNTRTHDSVDAFDVDTTSVN